MTAFEVAQKIDISAVRTQHTLRDIEEIVAYAKQYKFINVHVLPSWIKVLAPMTSQTFMSVLRAAFPPARPQRKQKSSRRSR